ncbi:MAG: hypothetical protein C0490_19690, partial [Marivirga sp.]|nr:hypothetical protein [Marivirga sp.]
YDSLNYFILHFSRNGKEIESAFVSDPANFKKIIDYLSFDLRNNIFLIRGSDTTQALDVVYARTFGGSEGTSVLAVFSENLKETGSTIKVCLDDTMLGLGLTEFEFDVNDIKNTPNLMFN